MLHKGQIISFFSYDLPILPIRYHLQSSEVKAKVAILVLSSMVLGGIYQIIPQTGAYYSKSIHVSQDS